MEAQKIEAIGRDIDPKFGNHANHKSSVTLDGLDDLFKWASEVVADGDDTRVKRARDERIRRQVRETVLQLREQEAVAKAVQENAYLHKRVIALLQKLQEYTEENATLKQIMVAQAFTLERLPALEKEIDQLKSIELDVESSRRECKDLLNALSKLKVERDYLDELLRLNEEENAKLTDLFASTRANLEFLQSKKWWQFWKR